MVLLKNSAGEPIGIQLTPKFPSPEGLATILACTSESDSGQSLEAFNLVTSGRKGLTTKRTAGMVKAWADMTEAEREALKKAKSDKPKEGKRS